ncbi:MAG: M56 family metallopeptidase [Pirellulales bacterium]
MSHAQTTSFGWLPTAMSIAIGIAVIVVLAECTSRFTDSACWRKTVWRFSLLGLLAFGICECTGLAATMLHIVMRPPAAVVTAAVPDQDNPDPWRNGVDSGTAVAPVSVPSNGDDGADIQVLLDQRRTTNNRHATTSAISEFAARQHNESHTEESDGLPAHATAAPQDARHQRTRPAAESTAVIHWLLLIWLSVMAALMIRVAWRHFFLFAFWRCQQVADDTDLLSRLQRLRLRMGVRRRVRLVKSTSTMSPVTLGLLSPTVAVPHDFSDQFTVDQQDTMLAHELAHIAGWDSIWQLTASLLGSLLWWHPAVWWARRQLGFASEIAADEASMLVPGGPKVLAGCLVVVGRQLTQSRRPAWLCIEGSELRSGLAQRVKTLLALHDQSWRPPRRGRMLISGTALLMAFFILAVSTTAWARPRHPLSQGDTSMILLTKQWQTSLAATVISTLLIPTVGTAFADEKDDREEQRTERRNPDRDNEERSNRDGERERDAERRHEGDREREADREREDKRDPRHIYEQAARAIRAAIEAGKITPEQGEQRLRGLREHLGKREREDHQDRERPHDDHARGDHPQGEHEHGVDPEIRRKIEHLTEARHQLEHRAEEVGEKLKAVSKDDRGLAKHLEEALREIKERHRAITREIEELLQHHREHGDRRSDHERDRPHEGGDDLQRRVRHLQLAAENLKAAGLHDEANRFWQDAENIIRELRNRTQERRENSRTDHPEHPRGDGGQAEVQQLRGEVEQLRRELHEIKNFLREITAEEGEDRE